MRQTSAMPHTRTSLSPLCTISTHVRPQGTGNPDDCVRQFVTSAGVRNYLSWDFIPMGAALVENTGATSLSACQTTCGANCQYFEWHDAHADNTDSVFETAGCYQRTGAVTRIDLSGTNPATVTYAVLFEVRGKSREPTAQAGSLARSSLRNGF